MLGIKLATAARPSAPRALRLRKAEPRPGGQVIRDVSVEGRAMWADARDRVATQVTDLSEHLLGTKDPNLVQIGKLGLPAVTSRLNTSLAVALIEVDAAPPDRAEAARAKARDAVAAMKRMIETDPLIKVLDENPLGLPVTIRATLGTALQQLGDALA